MASAPDLNALQARLGYTFRDPGYLRIALTHPSIAHEFEVSIPHNQRLEFLGDAVLGLIIARELYERFPRLGEGPMTKGRAHLVNQRTLAEQGRALGLGECLVMSKGETVHGGRERPSALADAFEAVTGAIYLDGGYDAASAFVLRCFRASFGEFSSLPNISNPKGELQEKLQEQSNESPHYSVLNATGPDHNRSFECAVYFAGRELGRGKGNSKRAAECDAARSALLAMERETPPPA